MSTRVTPRRWNTPILLLGFWTLIALSYTLSAGLSAISEGHPTNWSRMLVWNFTVFYLWMALGPLIARLSRQSAGHGWRRFAAVHVPASLGVALAHVVVHLLIYWVVCGPGTAPVTTYGAFLRMQFVYNYHFALLIYWVILVALRGLDSQRRLRDERLRNAQLESQLAQSQLRTLRVQLQPHFLFNTLNAISALALADPIHARLMIARLSDLLRLTLEERHALEVPLSRELELLRCYLDIQQVRFQDRLSTHLDVAMDTVHASVPSMILQPLVENALRHGLLDKPEPGQLQIVSRREGGQLYLRVDDDGLGLPEGVAEGFGLGNTRERLQVLFGKTASVALARKAEGGTRVELRFPFREYVAEPVL
ncbi:sensor histidine kinase [Dyella tabacisoli]|uniref:sensor histidine kinase n=1 Tax=Dyella tabacisoli TaxID=2282381 RepID=UPI001CDBF3A7|nr:histidine kinase [Dyella tabacisoli]